MTLDGMGCAWCGCRLFARLPGGPCYHGVMETQAKLMELIIGISERMATKDDLLGFEREIRSELKELRSVLTEFTEMQHDQSGFAMEIDHLMSRIAILEQRLNIEPNIVA